MIRAARGGGRWRAALGGGLLGLGASCGPTEGSGAPGASAAGASSPDEVPISRDAPRPDLRTAPEQTVVDAVERARAAVEQAPDSLPAWASYADLLAAYGWAEESAHCYRVAEQMQPEEFRWPYMRGQVLAEVDARRALADVRRAIERDERYAPAHVRAAALEIEVGDDEAARRSLQRALELDGENLDARLGLGRLLLDQGSVLEALQQLRAALSLDGTHPEVHAALARAYFLGNEAELADEHAAKARRHARKVALHDPRGELRLVPISCDDHVLAGLAAVRAQDLDKAHRLFQRAVEIDPEDRVARENLGLVLAQLEQIPAALEQYQELVERFPSVLPSRLRAAALLSRLDREEEARELLRQAWPEHADDEQLVRQLGASLLRAEQWAEAEAVFTTAREHHDTTFVRGALARCLERQGRHEAAAELLRGVVAEAPDEPDSRLLLAELCETLELPVEALEHRRALHELGGGRRETLMPLLQALRAAASALATAEPARAAALYDEALERKEDWPPALRGLAWLLATCPDDAVRDAPRALQLAERSLAASRQADASHLDTRAAAHAASGDFEAAVRDAEEALRRAGEAGRDDVAARIGQRLAGYREGRPYRASGADDSDA